MLSWGILFSLNVAKRNLRMFVGYLVICIGLECKVVEQGFNTLEKCETLGAEIELNLPKLQPNVTFVRAICEAVGVDT